MSLAEKFQITLPPKSEKGHEWASVKSAHSHKSSIQNDPANGQKFNRMPRGMDTNVEDTFVQGFGGNTDVTDNVNAASLGKGYFRAKMTGVDDQYSGEHIDLFYGEVCDELGNCGFVERNNYLDRL